MLPMEISPEAKERRLRFGRMARRDLLLFAVLNTPHPADALNPTLSRFEWVAHHYLIAAALERIARGEINRLEIELPPRHGKSELAVRNFVPFMGGNFPLQSGIVVTHTDTLAKEHGRDCRDYWLGMGFKLVFGQNSPGSLRTDSQASDRLQTEAGGVVTFSGRGGLGAGVGADWMIFDDFFKNSQEAESSSVREEAWRTFIADCQSRLNNEECPVIMIGSRRHEDDVQGRLFDPTNPHYDAQEAARWVRIRIPALSEGKELDPLQRERDEPLWPSKFGRAFYVSKREHKSDIVRIDFQTQDQCAPRPQEGTWFKKAWFKTYKNADLPKHLRIYVASDHAYRAQEKNDESCLLVVGIDPAGEIWVLPNTIWDRFDTAELADHIFKLFDHPERRPAQWWAARDAISGSIMPLLKRRMQDTHKYFWIDDSIAEKRDLVARSSSIRGLMAMGLVHWPLDWPLWPKAENQLLSFPGKKDDLVAALAMLGMGLDRMVKPAGDKPDNSPKRGTFAWHSQGQDKEVKSWI
ncbi:MAG: hypothetical protein KGL39_15700 [Patescibacteria group bacterium]|nr:hypothetical protein [Patescibacteria group bacterium]